MTDRSPVPGTPTIVPGTVIVHRDGKRQIIEGRKRDGTGWWLADGSGIADYVLDPIDGDWRITSEIAAFEPSDRCPHCDRRLPRGRRRA